jgi:hypothetical protein
MQSIDGLSKKKLQKLYWEQKLSSPKIAQMYQASPEKIRRLMKRYQIRIRTKKGSKEAAF